MGLLRKVSKGPLGLPSQQSVLAGAKKCIKETASLTSQNVFTISIFIKPVKECGHKAFQGLTALVVRLFWFCFFFLTVTKAKFSVCSSTLVSMNVKNDCLILEICSEWQAVFCKCLITPFN